MIILRRRRIQLLSLLRSVPETEAADETVNPVYDRLPLLYNHYHRTLHTLTLHTPAG